MAAGFFYSKTFKLIATVIFTVELIITITLKVVDLYCDELGCWNKKDWGTNYCMEHINSIYEEAMKRERAYEKAIPIHTGEMIPMMFIILMIRMISPMTGLRNSVEEL